MIVPTTALPEVAKATPVKVAAIAAAPAAEHASRFFVI